MPIRIRRGCPTDMKLETDHISLVKDVTDVIMLDKKKGGARRNRSV